jgi:predicted site-specific integrase-resolvase
VEDTPIVNADKETHIYCRVSSHNKKADLQRQIERCKDFCFKNGWSISSVTKEIASGMNDKRPKLMKLLNSNPTRIVVEHKDRLTRFGFNYFDVLLPKLNCELIVIDKDHQEENDLMKDLISIITSFCCRLYGLRKGKNKATKIKKELNEELQTSN